ncbi:MAG: hybrid sensor histidine kinase/response regulator [Pseudomonadales bacterium]
MNQSSQQNTHEIAPSALLVEQLQSMYPQVKFLFAAVLILTSLYLGLFWDKVSLPILLTWAALSYGLVAMRSVFLIYSKRRLSVENARKHALIFASGSTCSGIVWGSCNYFFLDLTDYSSIILIATILTGSVAGSLVTLSAFLPAFLGYSISALLPLAVILIGNQDSTLYWLGWVVVLFMISMVGYSYSVNQNLKRYITLRFSNSHLLEGLKVQRDAAERANIEKSRYLAATSHDLRQPLHALQLYLSNLELLQTTAQQRSLIDKSIQAGNTLNSLLSALMDISKIDSATLEVNFRSASLSKILNEIEREFRGQAEKQNVYFSVAKSDDNIITDPLLLTRCLRNLVSNALSHSRASNIEILLRHRQDEILLLVIDDGIGIKTKEQDKIFSEFYQLQNPERDRDKGLGLGLAIVKKLSHLLHHELTLTSQSGRGCSFQLTLPKAQFQPQETVNTVYDSDISGLWVMIIDDDAHIRDGMSLSFKNWGCEIIVAESLLEIKAETERYRYQAPDVIVADYRLREGKTGIEIISWARQHYAKFIPAIVLSGDTDHAVQQQSADVQATFMQKPCINSVLKAKVAELARATDPK